MGGCSPWLTETAGSLPYFANMLEISSLEFITASPEPAAEQEHFTCSGSVGLVFDSIINPPLVPVPVQCDGRSWLTKSCVNGKLATCIDCPDPCSSTCSTAAVLNPCGGIGSIGCGDDGNGIVRLLIARFESAFPPPGANVTGLISTRTSIKIDLNLTADGYVYVAAFPSENFAESTLQVVIPSSQPSHQPTSQPSRLPSSHPTSHPTSQPFRQPTEQPTRQPSQQPSSQPSQRPSSQPTRQPTLEPSSSKSHRKLTASFSTSSTISVDQIVSQNFKASSAGGIASVVVTGLIPSKKYDIYILTQSYNGIISPIASSIPTFEYSTQCCRVISVMLPSPYVSQGSSVSGAVSVSLDFPPDRHVDVLLQLMQPLGGTAAAAPAAALIPQFLTFSSSSVSLFAAIDIFFSSTSSVVGVLGINATILVSDSKNYDIYFRDGAELSVLSQNQAPPPPAIRIAQFSNDGMSVIVDFDSPTNQAGVTTASSFPCPQLLYFYGSRTQPVLCQWTSAASVVATLGASASVVVGGFMTLVPHKLKASCPAAGNARSCMSWNFSVPVNESISAPAAPLVPIVSVSAPALIGSCSLFTLDLTSSSGSSGRSWATVSITAQSPSLAVDTQQLNLYLQRSYTLSPPTQIPSQLLEVGLYSFSIVLCNFLGSCGQGSHSLTVTATQVPTVTIFGSSYVQILRSASLSLSSDAFISSCDGTSEARSGIVLAWTVYQAGSLNVSIVSSSRQADTFVLPAYSLNAQTLYRINLQALSTVSSVASFTSIQVGECYYYCHCATTTTTAGAATAAACCFHCCQIISSPALSHFILFKTVNMCTHFSLYLFIVLALICSPCLPLPHRLSSVFSSSCPYRPPYLFTALLFFTCVRCL